MPSVQLASDLHLEFYPDKGKGFVEGMNTDGVDILVLAGDITTEATLGETLVWFCRRFPEVVYLTGNHEYYGSRRETVQAVINAVAAKFPNLHWLEDSFVELQGVRFIGSTLWFRDHPDGLNARFSGCIHDFNYIQGFRSWVYQVNARSRAFLEANVRPTDFVVTHHIPHTLGVLPKWRSEEYRDLNRFFECDMSGLIARIGPQVWAFGHTHDSCDKQIGPTRLLCNPFGYYLREQNPHYNPRLIIEVES